jgi:hypothetical protein
MVEPREQDASMAILLAALVVVVLLGALRGCYYRAYVQLEYHEDQRKETGRRHGEQQQQQQGGSTALDEI